MIFNDLSYLAILHACLHHNTQRVWKTSLVGKHFMLYILTNLKITVGWVSPSFLVKTHDLLHFADTDICDLKTCVAWLKTPLTCQTNDNHLLHSNRTQASRWYANANTKWLSWHAHTFGSDYKPTDCHQCWGVYQTVFSDRGWGNDIFKSTPTCFVKCYIIYRIISTFLVSTGHAQCSARYVSH